MDSKAVETFYYNFHWFNDFFSDLKTVLEKIAETILNNTEYVNYGLYYSKMLQQPQVPSLYQLHMDGENLNNLQILAVLDDGLSFNQYLEIKEPSIAVISHEYEENPGWLGNNIMNSTDHIDLKRDGGIVTGKVSWEPYPKFRIIVFPIDEFSDYDDEKVIKEIVHKLDD